IALSYDHRILNGAQAAIALTAFKNNLEEPMRMMLR
ncbi:MAG: 2-oxoacid dehydrogenases acyltransferase (catalytic domain), partial [Rhodobacteraceae bacterium HLUCCA08]